MLRYGMFCGFEAHVLGLALYTSSKPEFICHFCHIVSTIFVAIAITPIFLATYESSNVLAHGVLNWSTSLVLIDQKYGPF